jgi:lipopolysaccharide export LptBFGC system permease protein LptF
MKKLTLLFAVLFASSMAVAAENAAPAAEKKAETKSEAAKSADAKAPAAAKSMTHDVTAEVVSADMTKKEITIKDEKGESHTAPVEGKAVAALKTVKTGEKVTVTCRDNEKGEHQAVTAIKPAAATGKKPASVKSSDTKPAIEKPAASSEKSSDKPAETK